MTPGESNGVYKAINELQSTLVGLVEDARQESREDHLALLKRLDAQDERLRHLEKKSEPTPWPPMRKGDIVLTDAPDGDNKPILRLTWATAKRLGWAMGAFIGMVTAANLAVDGFVRFLGWLGFHR